MKTRMTCRSLALASVLVLLLGGCAPATALPTTETRVPTPTRWLPPTPTTPPRDITLTAPEEHALVSNPVEVRGRVTVMPFEGTLRGRVYDAQGRVVGEVPIQARADEVGELGGPGSVSGTIPYQVEAPGPGLVEIADVSVRDGSIVVSATVAVSLTATPSSTATTPPRDIIVTEPREGASVSSPVEVHGRVTVMPFEGTLLGRVYDANGEVVGEVPIQATADVVGELGGPGSFHGTIPFQTEDAGSGRVEIAEVSVRDGALVASTAVQVTLMPHEPPDLHEMDVREEWTSPSPDRMWVARGLAAFPAGSEEEHKNRYYTHLSVARSDSSREWMILDKWSVLALGYTTPQPLQWSSNGRFFYFTNRPVPDGCAVFVNGSDPAGRRLRREC